MHRRSAVLCIVASAASFATLAVLARLAYSYGGRPLPLLTWRFAIAAALMVAYLGIRHRHALRAGWREIPAYAAVSLTSYGVASICFFFSLRHITASVATVLLYAYPAIVTIAEAGLSRARIPRVRLAAVALTFVGCALAAGMAGSASSVNLPGVGLALGAAAGYAVYAILSSRLVGTGSRLVVMSYTFGFSALAVGAVSLLAGESLSPTGWPGELWLALGLIVAVPTLLAVILFLSAVRSLGASQAALVSSLEPVFTVLLAAAVLGERMTAPQLVGAAMVVGGIAISEVSRRVAEGPATL